MDKFPVDIEEWMEFMRVINKNSGSFLNNHSMGVETTVEEDRFAKWMWRVYHQYYDPYYPFELPN